MTNIILSDIYIYPVKSLGGMRVENWPVTATGLKYDRKWMLIDSERQFLSQRRLPKMALISTSINDHKLFLSAPGMPNLPLDLEPKQGEWINCTIWQDQLQTLTVSSEADLWLSQFLQTDCRLVYQPESSIRIVNPAFAKSDDITALSDGFPFLLVSENSLAALNKVMQLDMSMSRFRPNLVVSGCTSYAEDGWREIAIGSIDFRLPKPCSRCSVPTVNPLTGEAGKEPLTTLNQIRKWENKVYFGQNALHDGCGELSVGDKVNVKVTGKLQPPL